MVLFLFALFSILILIPVLYILPLGFSRKGKHFILGVSIVIAVLSLMASLSFEWWQSVLIYILLLLLFVLVIDKRFGATLYEQFEQDNNKIVSQPNVEEVEETFTKEENDQVAKDNDEDTELKSQPVLESEAEVEKDETDDDLSFLFEREDEKDDFEKTITELIDQEEGDLLEEVIERNQVQEDEETDNSLEEVAQLAEEVSEEDPSDDFEGSESDILAELFDNFEEIDQVEEMSALNIDEDMLTASEAADEQIGEGGYLSEIEAMLAQADDDGESSATEDDTVETIQVDDQDSEETFARDGLEEELTDDDIIDVLEPEQLQTTHNKTDQEESADEQANLAANINDDDYIIPFTEAELLKKSKQSTDDNNS